MTLKINPKNLAPLWLAKRNQYLDQQPAIVAIYDFKQNLHVSGYYLSF